MGIDDGILSRRRWVLLGAIALLLLAGAVVLAVTGAQDAPRRVVVAAPTWRIGDNARVTIALDASNAAGSVDVHGSPCRMAAGAVGKITGIGGPLSSPRGWLEVATPRCAGWVWGHLLAPAP